MMLLLLCASVSPAVTTLSPNDAGETQAIIAMICHEHFGIRVLQISDARIHQCIVRETWGDTRLP